MSKKCGVCDEAMTPLGSLGRVALAGDFRPIESDAGKRYPLSVHFCGACALFQVGEVIDPEILFTDYRYFSGASRTYRNHAKAYAKDVQDRFAPKSVLEIGCNDGTLLSLMAASVTKAVGVDPASNVVETISDPRLSVRAAFWGEAEASRCKEAHGRFDVVIANNVLAHVADVNEFMRATLAVLGDRGVLVAELHDAQRMVEDVQYDWIYHEHRYYHGVLSMSRLLQRHGMELFHVEPQSMHGGSLRFYAARIGDREKSDSVVEKAWHEMRTALHTAEAYEAFLARAHAHNDELCGVLDALSSDGAKIAAYGASGRAAAMLQWNGGRAARNIRFAIDDSPARIGTLMPGTRIPIRNRHSLENIRPTHMLLTAWSYADEIKKKCMGIPLILPFPHPCIEELEPA